MLGISSSTLSRNVEFRRFNLFERRFGHGMPTRYHQGSKLSSISRHLEEVILEFLLGFCFSLNSCKNGKFDMLIGEFFFEGSSSTLIHFFTEFSCISFISLN